MLKEKIVSVYLHGKQGGLDVFEYDEATKRFMVDMFGVTRGDLLPALASPLLANTLAIWQEDR